MKSTPILIIGAGPGGLAVGGRLRQAGLDFEVVEQSGNIAHSWHNHYDRLHLHTVKQLSALPGLEFPEDYPLFVPRTQLIQYYEQYAGHFNIQPHFHAKVTDIKPTQDQKWEVHIKDQEGFMAERVVIATGVNRVPYYPHWNGQENFRGELVHSRYYKNPEPFLGKKVLIIGMGNTGAEIALDLAKHDVKTYLSVRSPVNVVPLVFMGKPTQLTAKKLEKIPFGLGDWLGTRIRRIAMGNLKKYGLKTAKMSPAKQLRETGRTPVIDLGTIDQIKAGKIKVLPDIDHFNIDGLLLFKNDEQHHFDAIILATGYRAQIEDFLEDTEGLLDDFHVPKSPVGSGRHRGLYFVGFDNYKLGGILGTIYTDSELIVNNIQKAINQ
jgi:cation diffusion facilitator CzcD-associated flavoprotein CzcO